MALDTDAGNLVLHLGVMDVPYFKTPTQKVPQAKKGKLNKPLKSATGTQTTGQVAGYLEKKYGLFQSFADLHTPDIAEMLEGSIAGALETLAMGGSPKSNPFGSATSKIEKLFKFQYLDKEEIAQTGAPGVPTQAAKDGVNHRMKGGRGPRRPSFIDTGLLQSSVKVWID